MSKRLLYVAFWSAGIILFNLICFLAPIGTGTDGGRSGGFWVGYGFVIASFVLHFAFSYVTLSEKNKDKKVLNEPLIIISIFELCLMVLVGIGCMVIPGIPAWIGIIACYVILLLSVVFLTTAKAVGESASIANRTVNAKTNMFRELADMAHELVVVSSSSEEKQLAQRVFDAIKYSDMVSSDETAEDEKAIHDHLENIIMMVKGKKDFSSIKQSVDKLLLLLEIRNNKCKTSKRKQ